MLYRLRLLVSVALLCLGLALPARATHIVGGEFSMRRVSPGLFDIRLTLYFDDINGSTGAIDGASRVFIAAKRDPNFLPIPIEMALEPNQPLVAYSNPECEFVSGAVRTRILGYSSLVMLDESSFTDTGGYYLVYERCCRNGVIGNIFDPGGTGQAFYLEFPAMRPTYTVNGPGGPVTVIDTIINSSPTLFRPLSDFACRNQDFLFDFSGQDPDGDSLAYELVAPLAGFTSSGAPGQWPIEPAPFVPAPYPTVDWLPGFSDQVQIQGPNPINIDPRTGVLRMTPDQIGLFVFAIECREYRNGQYLGKVRREFQVFIRDCPTNSPPIIALADPSGPTNPSDPGYRSLQNGDTLTLLQGNGVCTPLRALDSIPDTQVFSLFSTDFPTGVRIGETRGNTTNGTFTTSLCIDDCLTSDTLRYGRLRIRLRDNACAIPGRDSVEIVLKVVPTPLAPAVVPGLGFFVGNDARPDTLIPTGPVIVNALALDSGADVRVSASISPALPRGVTVIQTGPRNQQSLSLQFDIPCDADTGIVYTLTVIATSERCNAQRSDTAIMRFRHFRPPTQVLLSLSDSAGNAVDSGQTLRIRPGQTLVLTGTGQVSDLSSVTVGAESTYGMGLLTNFNQASGPGIQAATLRWQAICADAQLPGADTGFALSFTASSVECSNVLKERSAIRVIVEDTVGGEPTAGNIITPNGDTENEYFRFKEPLPVDNCAGRFEGVDIYNRWGRKVFHSDDIHFAWRPDDGRAGLFFYRLVFQGREYRGWVESTANVR